VNADYRGRRHDPITHRGGTLQANYTDDTRGLLLDIIWYVTAACRHNCADCCVAAIEVRQRGSQVHLSSPTLAPDAIVLCDHSMGNIFAEALRVRQVSGLELTLEEKFRHRPGGDIRASTASPGPSVVRRGPSWANRSKERVSLFACSINRPSVGSER
jgi:hypothetical protein